VRKNKILYIFIKMCDCELQICCCKECESAFKNSVSASASALTNQDVLVYATASASASSEISFQDAWLKADAEANRLAKYYAELEANTIDTTFNIIETQAISTYEINNETDITTDTLTASSIETDTLTASSIETDTLTASSIETDTLTVNGASETNGITNTGNITTDTLNNITVAQIDSELLNVIIGNSAANVTTASSNVALGIGALENLTTGTNNVAVGTYALSSNTEGSYNTVIGDSVDFDSNGPYDYSTAIGYSAQITHSNQIVVGTSRETIDIQGGLNFSTQNLTATSSTNTFTLTTPLKQYNIVVGAFTGAAATVTLPNIVSTGIRYGIVVQFKNMLINTTSNIAGTLTITTALTSGTNLRDYIIPSTTGTALPVAINSLAFTSAANVNFIYGPYYVGAIEYGAWYQQG